VSARRPFDPDHDGPLLSAYVDGELDTEYSALVKQWLAEDPRAEQEVERLVQLKSFTDHLVLREAPPESWDEFRGRVTTRAQLGLGWSLLLLGIGVVGGYLLLRLGAAILTAAIPLVVRLGVFVGAAGLLVLILSALRQRLFARKRDRYDRIQR
jgi:anti-sigma factor RsiW